MEVFFEAGNLQRDILYHKKKPLSTVFCNFFLFTKKLSRNKKETAFAEKTPADLKKMPKYSHTVTGSDKSRQRDML